MEENDDDDEVRRRSRSRRRTKNRRLVYAMPDARLLSMGVERDWMPLRTMKRSQWYSVWDGRRKVRCRVLKERGAEMVDLFEVDAGTRLGFDVDDDVRELQMWQRWTLPPPPPPATKTRPGRCRRRRRRRCSCSCSCSCSKKHDPSTILSGMFRTTPSERLGAFDVKIPLARLACLDEEGVEILETVRFSRALDETAMKRWDPRGCFTWRQLADKALREGGDARSKVTVTLEREEEDERCESLLCVDFLRRQCNMMIRGLGAFTRSKKRLYVRHENGALLRTLRRLLHSIGGRSVRPSILRSNRVGARRRRYLELFVYPPMTPEEKREADTLPGPILLVERAKRSRLPLPLRGGGGGGGGGRAATTTTTTTMILLEFDVRSAFLLDGNVYLPSERDDVETATTTTSSADDDVSRGIE